ncbi:hypothetical protein MetMK1DRAFT_00005950 [Metallosphaera yellowstonensis MK1]|uniref:Uncharacterized protein n=1 Tax=Metallosphaera yellowstonensis MK1 TaxID=671065 RepID=H2C1H2_9CREN|nr:hypothetical protein MetMK1DRAFT_00005950 [Metallosphaera yellowstonensis MK1]
MWSSALYPWLYATARWGKEAGSLTIYGGVTHMYDRVQNMILTTLLEKERFVKSFTITQYHI